MTKNKQLMAFEEYYTMTKGGKKDVTKTIRYLSEKYDTDPRTIYRWKKENNWDKVATERSIEVNKKLAGDLKEQSDKALENQRKPFISILNRLIARCVSENEVKIKNIKDLVLVMKTINELQTELDIGTKEVVTVNYDRDAHAKVIDDILKELKSEGTDTKGDSNESGLSDVEVFEG